MNDCASLAPVLAGLRPSSSRRCRPRRRLTATALQRYGGGSVGLPSSASRHTAAIAPRLPDIGITAVGLRRSAESSATAAMLLSTAFGLMGWLPFKSCSLRTLLAVVAGSFAELAVQIFGGGADGGRWRY